MSYIHIVLNITPTLYEGCYIVEWVLENRPVDPGSIQGSHRPISFMIKHSTRADDILCKTEENNHLGLVEKKHIIRTCLMYHAACKVGFQPFKQVVLTADVFQVPQKIRV